jgi:hypothetical protein
MPIQLLAEGEVSMSDTIIDPQPKKGDANKSDEPDDKPRSPVDIDTSSLSDLNAKWTAFLRGAKNGEYEF